MLVPAFLQHTGKYEAGTTARKLVVVQLSGGNDGLNTIIPYRNDAYYRHRPKIRISSTDVIQVDDNFGFNPNLAALQSHFDRGNMAVINNVGYPNPDRSHFRSMEIWHSASDASERLRTGWLGRYLDAYCSDDEGAHLAVEINDILTMALKGERYKGMAMRNPEKLYKLLNGKLIRNLADQQVPAGNSSLQYLYKTMAEGTASAAYIFEKYRIERSNADYPQNRFGAQMNTIARMIKSGIDTRIYYCSLSGFDTHVRQQPTQNRLLGLYAEGMNAFMQDLERHDCLENVLILTFSEFGRRVAENASGGTDHGKAGNVFLMGGGLKRSGFLNEAPDLIQLDDGDLRFSIDFRRIYATLLDGWLDISHREVLGKSFERLNFI